MTGSGSRKRCPVQMPFAMRQTFNMRGAKLPCQRKGSVYALGGFLRFFKSYRAFIPTVERVAGVLLVAVGVLVITNYYIVLNAWALGLTPEWLLKLL